MIPIMMSATHAKMIDMMFSLRHVPGIVTGERWLNNSSFQEQGIGILALHH